MTNLATSPPTHPPLLVIYAVDSAVAVVSSVVRDVSADGAGGFIYSRGEAPDGSSLLISNTTVESTSASDGGMAFLVFFLFFFLLTDSLPPSMCSLQSLSIAMCYLSSGAISYRQARFI